MNRIKLGLIGMAIPDLFMGEEMCPDKTRELQVYLEGLGYEVKAASDIALSASDARRLGRELNDPDIDCIVVAVSTFIGDYYMSELVASADKPLFLWLIERELQCITLVAGPLCAAALKDLHHPYCISSDDIGGVYTTEKLRVFALACRAVNRTKMMHIGFCGGKASHMFSQSCDEIALRNMTGATVVHIPLEELYAAFEEADEGQAEALWGKLTEEVGCVKSPLASGIESCKYYLASKKLVER